MLLRPEVEVHHIAVTPASLCLSYAARVRARPWLIAIPVIVAIVAAAVLLRIWAHSSTPSGVTVAEATAGFYNTPVPADAAPGTLLRTEPLGVTVPGASALRMLYVTQRADGSLATSGGRIFIPAGPAPAQGRPVVAWAHGTAGMGDSCAPSRSGNPVKDTEGWLSAMLAQGWVVVAPDYAGLGTPGPQEYLVGQSEARDVVNAVRAVRQFPAADAGARYAVYGHSQGGHSALWTADLSSQIAPELTLVAVAAAAPAIDLPSIVHAQWDTLFGWAIGPELAISWPLVDRQLSPDMVLGPTGRGLYHQLADLCSSNPELLVQVIVHKIVRQKFFNGDPLNERSWAAEATAQTPPPPNSAMPVLIAQGTSDEVVLPWPNARVQQEWCDAGTNLSMLWMGGVDHQGARIAAGPSVVAWLAQRFAGAPAVRTCDFPPAVSPAPTDVTAMKDMEDILKDQVH